MSDEDFGVFGNGVPVLSMEFEFALSNFAKEPALIVVDEGGVASKEDIENYAYAPHIS